MTALEDTEHIVRQAAVQAVVKVVGKTQDDIVIQRVLAKMQHEDRKIRAVVMEVLQGISLPGDQRIVQGMLEALRHPHAQVRKMAVGVISSVAHKGDDIVIGNMAESLADADADVRRAAIDAIKDLADVNSSTAITQIVCQLTNAEWFVRDAAQEVTYRMPFPPHSHGRELIFDTLVVVSICLICAQADFMQHWTDMKDCLETDSAGHHRQGQCNRACLSARATRQSRVVRARDCHHLHQRAVPDMLVSDSQRIGRYVPMQHGGGNHRHDRRSLLEGQNCCHDNAASDCLTTRQEDRTCLPREAQGWRFQRSIYSSDHAAIFRMNVH